MTGELREVTCVKPLLTIAIPTYKRASYLRELLVVLFDQLLCESRVELIISDNDSPDETPAVVNEFVKQGLQIRYLRNEANVGADANFLQCFDQARGKYVWIFGDDDIIVPDGIAKILKLLAMGEHSLVYVSPYWFHHDYKAEGKPDFFGRFAEILPDGVQFARKVGLMIGFISGMIVNKELYGACEIRDELSNLNGSGLGQLGYVFPILRNSSNNLIVWERLVAARAGNTGGWGVVEVFGVNFKRVSEAHLSDRPDIAKALRISALRSWFPTPIMLTRRGRAEQMKTENTRELLESCFKDMWQYWIYIYPLLVLPTALAEIWFQLDIISDRAGKLMSAIFSYFFLRKNIVKRPE